MTTRKRGPAKEPVLAAGAPASPKAYRNHVLTIGPIPIPISIVSSVMTPDGLRQQFVKSDDGDYHSVGMRPYDKVTGLNIDDASSVVKGVQTEDGVVELTTEDMKLGSTRACKVVKFIDLAELPQNELRLICPTKFYQIRPQPLKVGRETRPNVHAEQILTLVLEEMEELNAHAIVQITMADDAPPQMALLDWGAQLRLLAYQQFIREEPALPVVEHSSKDKALAQRLIKSMMTSYMPANMDTSREHLERVLATKKAGGQLVEPAPTGVIDGLPVMDITEVFTKALAARKTRT